MVGDVTDRASLSAATEGVDRVFHCAALVGDWLDRDDIRRVNVDGTANVLDACAAARVGRLVYLSSLAVLGTKHHHGTDESAPYAKTGDNTQGGIVFEGTLRVTAPKAHAAIFALNQ